MDGHNVYDHHITNMWYEVNYQTNSGGGMYCLFSDNTLYEMSKSQSQQTQRIPIPSSLWKVSATTSLKVWFYSVKPSQSGKEKYAKTVHWVRLIVEHTTNADSQQATVDEVDIGSPQIVHITNPISGLYHDVEWKYGYTTYTLEKTTDLNPAWTPTFEQQQAIATYSYQATNDKTIAYGTVTVKTYETATSQQIGGDYIVNTRMNITPAFAAPDITIGNISDLEDERSRPPKRKPDGFDNRFLQNFQDLKIPILFTLKYGAELINGNIVVKSPDGKAEPIESYVGTNTAYFEIQPKFASDQYIISAAITDTRGFTQTTIKTIEVEGCSSPSIIDLTAYRCKEDTYDGTVPMEYDEGGNAYVQLIFKGNKLLENLNCNISVAICTESGQIIEDIDEYEESVNINEDTRIGTTAFIVDGENKLAKDSNYKIQVQITDSFGQTTTELFPLGAATYSIYRQAGGVGVSFGKISTLYGVEIREDWPFYTHGKEIEELLLDYAHPIGSIIQTLDAQFDPNVKWPWTQWGKLENVFLLGSGERNVLETGGSETEIVYGTTFDVEGIDITLDYKNLPDWVLMYPSKSEYMQPIRNALKVDGTQGYSEISFQTGQTNCIAKDFTKNGIRPVTQPISVPTRQITIDNQNISTMPPYITVNIWVRAR